MPGDFISAFGDGMAALAELTVRGTIFVVRRAGALIVYACSSAYRAKNAADWQGRKFAGMLELGFSALCLAGLLGLTGWAVWAGMEHSRAKERAALRRHETTIGLQVKGAGTGKSVSWRRN